MEFIPPVNVMTPAVDVGNGTGIPWDDIDSGDVAPELEGDVRGDARVDPVIIAVMSPDPAPAPPGVIAAVPTVWPGNPAMKPACAEEDDEVDEDDANMFDDEDEDEEAKGDALGAENSEIWISGVVVKRRLVLGEPLLAGPIDRTWEERKGFGGWWWKEEAEPL